MLPPGAALVPRDDSLISDRLSRWIVVGPSTHQHSTPSTINYSEYIRPTRFQHARRIFVRALVTLLARIPRRRHRHGHPREDPRRHVRHARFREVIPAASWTTRRHSSDDPREDVGEDVGIGVGVVDASLLAVPACLSVCLSVTVWSRYCISKQAYKLSLLYLHCVKQIRISSTTRLLPYWTFFQTLT